MHSVPVRLLCYLNTSGGRLYLDVKCCNVVVDGGGTQGWVDTTGVRESRRSGRFLGSA